MQETALNWNEAKTYCTERGTELASIANVEEREDLRLLFEMNNMDPAKHIWIGLNDKGQEGVYVWNDGTQEGIIEWNSGEPNDTNGQKDCVFIHVGSMKLFVAPCSGWEKLNFVCKFA